jgi:hypothetical protein
MKTTHVLVVAAVAFALAAGCKHHASQRLLGCYVDNGDSGGTTGRDLDGEMFTPEKLTVEKCLAHCRQKGFAYAGVQYASQCFCGKSYGKFGKAPDSECDAKCEGNEKETCGGTWRSSVYKL